MVCPTLETLRGTRQFAKSARGCLIVPRTMAVALQLMRFINVNGRRLLVVRVRPIIGYAPAMLMIWRTSGLEA